MILVTGEEYSIRITIRESYCVNDILYIDEGIT